MNVYFAGKSPIKDFVANQDAIITLVDIAGGFQPVARPAFGMTKGGGEIPWYVFELPVIVVGTKQPFVLADIPQHEPISIPTTRWTLRWTHWSES